MSMNRRIFLIAASTVITTLIVGCTADGAGDEYIGTWFNDDGKFEIKVTQDGGAFLMEVNLKSGSDIRKVPARLTSHNSLEFDWESGPQRAAISTATGDLLVFGKEFRKISP